MKPLSELIEASYTQKYEIENTRRTKDMAPLVCIDVIHYDRMKRVAIELAKALDRIDKISCPSLREYRTSKDKIESVSFECRDSLTRAKDIIGVRE